MLFRSQSILKKENFYNIRIFAVFDEYELNTRFIKANIKKYINKESLIIHQNKYMDFFNMLDLISIVEYVMLNDDAPKEIDCTYSKSNTLFEIAEMINNLDEHKVSIKVENPTLDVPYVGKYTPLGIEYIGLESSIKNTYNILKNEIYIKRYETNQRGCARRTAGWYISRIVRIFCVYNANQQSSQ